jgi:hypothetical protein
VVLGDEETTRKRFVAHPDKSRFAIATILRARRISISLPFRRVSIAEVGWVLAKGNPSSSFAQICVDSGPNRSKEELPAELIEYPKSLELVFDGVFKLGKGQFHTPVAKRFIQF